MSKYFEEIDESKYSSYTLVPTNESKETKLPLNKTIEIPAMIIAVKAVFHESNKCYPHVFSDEYLYKF